MFALSLLIAVDIPLKVMLMLPQAVFNLTLLLVIVRYQVMLIVLLLSHLLSILIMKPGSLILAQRRV